jgi:hypothetical protein
MDNIKEFSSVLKETEEKYEGITHFEMLENLLFDLSLRSEHDDSKSDESVRLTTFHQAKGLEFGAKTKSPVNQGYSIAKAKFTVKKEEPKEAPSVSYSIGDKINHKAFGDGLVVAVSGTTITVAFKAPFGVKQLNGNHPSIRKI